MFSPIPLRLETDRLILTQQTPADAGWLAELFTARGGGTVTTRDAEAKIAEMQRVVAEHGIGARVLRTKSDGSAIGYCAIIVGRGSLEEPEPAFELLPSAHGHGYATEASRELLAATFATGRTRIWSTVRTWNAPSFRVLEKLGFHRDHTTEDENGQIVWMVRDRGDPALPTHPRSSPAG